MGRAQKGGGARRHGRWRPEVNTRSTQRLAPKDRHTRHARRAVTCGGSPIKGDLGCRATRRARRLGGRPKRQQSREVRCGSAGDGGAGGARPRGSASEVGGGGGGAERAAGRRAGAGQTAVGSQAKAGENDGSNTSAASRKRKRRRPPCGQRSGAPGRPRAGRGAPIRRRGRRQRRGQHRDDDACGLWGWPLQRAPGRAEEGGGGGEAGGRPDDRDQGQLGWARRRRGRHARSHGPRLQSG